MDKAEAKRLQAAYAAKRAEWWEMIRRVVPAHLHALELHQAQKKSIDQGVDRP